MTQDQSKAQGTTDHQNQVRAEAAAVVSGRALDYALLLKPRVMSLVVFTGLVGAMIAPGALQMDGAGWLNLILAVGFIAIGAGGSGAINMWYDQDIDKDMARTKNRPIPAGRVSGLHALWLGLALSAFSVTGMTLLVNTLAGALLALTIFYYIAVYTIWLKRRTPQNIVIGGAAGAFPPMIGWVAVTGTLDWGAASLFAIIFLWTPPHFWALALFRTGDYAKVGVPMLPVVAGKAETKRQILIYTWLLAPVAVAPALLGIASPAYGVLALLLNAWFLTHAYKVRASDASSVARRMFFVSIAYLFLIFVFLLIDRVVITFVT